MRFVLRGLLVASLLAVGMAASSGCSKDDPDSPEWKSKAPEVPPVSSKEGGKKTPEKK